MATFDNPTFNADVYYNGTLLGAAGTTATSVTGSSFYTSLQNMGSVVDLSAYEPALAEETPVMTVTAEGDVIAAYLAPPSLAAIAQGGSGGTLAAATYYYAVTAVNAQGETTVSNILSATTTNATSTVALTWSEPGVVVAGSLLEAVVGTPSSYNVYRGTSSTVLDHQFLNKTSPWTDTGAAADSTATLPLTHNTAELAGAVRNY
jgi:hypothetical protein